MSAEDKIASLEEQILQLRNDDSLRELAGMGLRPRLTGHRQQYVTMYKLLADGRIDESRIPVEREWEQSKEGYSRVKPDLGYELKHERCPHGGCTLEIPYPYAEAQSQDAARSIVKEHVRLKHTSLWKAWEDVERQEMKRREQERIDEMQAVLKALAGRTDGDKVAALEQQMAELRAMIAERDTVPSSRSMTPEEKAAWDARRSKKGEAVSG